MRTMGVVSTTKKALCNFQGCLLNSRLRSPSPNLPFSHTVDPWTTSRLARLLASLELVPDQSRGRRLQLLLYLLLSRYPDLTVPMDEEHGRDRDGPKLRPFRDRASLLPERYCHLSHEVSLGL